MLSGADKKRHDGSTVSRKRKLKVLSVLQKVKRSKIFLKVIRMYSNN